MELSIKYISFLRDIHRRITYCRQVYTARSKSSLIVIARIVRSYTLIHDFPLKSIDIDIINYLTKQFFFELFHRIVNVHF